MCPGSGKPSYDTSLTGGQGAVIEPLRPVRDPRRGGAPLRYERRLVIDAVLHVRGTGCAWRRRPHDLAPWDVAYRWFSVWTAEGTGDQVHEALRDRVQEADGRAVPPAAAVLDAPSVTSAEGGEAIGDDAGTRMRGRPRHLRVDTCGLPLKAVVPAASAQDRPGAKLVLTGIHALFPLIALGWVDGGYVHVVDDKLVGGAADTEQIDLVVVPPTTDGPGLPVLPRRRVVAPTVG